MAEQVEVPQGKALEDLRRQRDEARQRKAEEKAGAPTPDSGVAGKAKGGRIRGQGMEKRGRTKGRFV